MAKKPSSSRSPLIRHVNKLNSWPIMSLMAVFIVFGVYFVWQGRAAIGRPDIVAKAASQVGVAESPLGSNSGPRVDIYTAGHAEPWCADFVSWVYKETGHRLSGGASGGWRIPAVINLAQWFKDHGVWHTRAATSDVPQPGDMVHFNWNSCKSCSENNHAGLVEKVVGSTLYTIEGNSSDRVSRRTYTGYRSNSNIIGWGRLNPTVQAPLHHIDIFARGGDSANTYSMWWNGVAWSSFDHNLGGGSAGSPAVSSRSANVLDLFIRGSGNNSIHTKYWDGDGWSIWHNLGGSFASGPAAVSKTSTSIDVFATAPNGHVLTRWWNPTNSWSPGWGDVGIRTNTGGTILAKGEPAVASWGYGRLDLFIRGTDDQLWHKYWTNGNWSDWGRLGGKLISSPAAVSRTTNVIDIFYRGADNALYTIWWNGAEWGGPGRIGSVLTSAPAVSSWASNRLDVFYRGGDNGLWHRYWNGSWSNEGRLGGNMTSAPAAVSRY
jgi:hypothetical protein